MRNRRLAARPRRRLMVICGLVLTVAAALLWLRPQRRSIGEALTEKAAVAGRLALPHDLAASDVACVQPARYRHAAERNAGTLMTADWTPFGASEVGWAVYSALIARELGTLCGPSTPAFAESFGRWQRAHGFDASGEVNEPALKLMATSWLLRRPFVRAMKTGCPPPPPEAKLTPAAANETFGGKAVLLRPAALAAYRRMAAAARRDLPLEPSAFVIASGFRPPADEAARCAKGGCGTAAKARCSAHRTGLALDLYLGSGPSSRPFSSSPEERLLESRTPAYRWLVAHAEEFGFVPYPFEPWHWEWTGETV